MNVESLSWLKTSILFYESQGKKVNSEKSTFTASILFAVVYTVFMALSHDKCLQKGENIFCAKSEQIVFTLTF